jgi:hypothetical protein
MDDHVSYIKRLAKKEKKKKRKKALTWIFSFGTGCAKFHPKP